MRALGKQPAGDRCHEPVESDDRPSRLHVADHPVDARRQRVIQPRHRFVREMHVASHAGHDAAGTRIGVGRGDHRVLPLLAVEQHEVFLDEAAENFQRLALRRVEPMAAAIQQVDDLARAAAEVPGVIRQQMRHHRPQQFPLRPTGAWQRPVVERWRAREPCPLGRHECRVVGPHIEPLRHVHRPQPDLEGRTRAEIGPVPWSVHHVPTIARRGAPAKAAGSRLRKPQKARGCRRHPAARPVNRDVRFSGS